MESEVINPLSKEFEVAVKIYELTGSRRQKVWFNKLVEVMEGRMSRQTIWKCVKTLLDWGILKIEFGNIPGGGEAKLLTIHHGSIPTIRHLYLLTKHLQKN